MLFKNVIAGV